MNTPCLAEHVAPFRQPLARRRPAASSFTTRSTYSRATIAILDRELVGAHEGRGQRDRLLAGQPANGAQHLQLGVDRQPVAALRPPRWWCRAPASPPAVAGPPPPARSSLASRVAATVLTMPPPLRRYPHSVAPASRRCSSSRRSPAYTRWVCGSTKPGTTVRPRPSSTRALRASDTAWRPSWAGPTKTMRPVEAGHRGARQRGDVTLGGAPPRGIAARRSPPGRRLR